MSGPRPVRSHHLVLRMPILRGPSAPAAGLSLEAQEHLAPLLKQVQELKFSTGGAVDAALGSSGSCAAPQVGAAMGSTPSAMSLAWKIHGESQQFAS